MLAKANAHLMRKYWAAVKAHVTITDFKHTKGQTCLSFAKRLFQAIRSHVIRMLRAVVFSRRWHFALWGRSCAADRLLQFGNEVFLQYRSYLPAQLLLQTMPLSRLRIGGAAALSSASPSFSFCCREPRKSHTSVYACVRLRVHVCDA